MSSLLFIKSTKSSIVFDNITLKPSIHTLLVVAVVGVSFAFFSYTKTGTQSNTIATGQIYTYLTDGNQMTLSDAMPVQTDPTTVINSTTGDVGALTFTVVGKNESDATITYKAYLVTGQNTTGKTGSALADSDIGVLVQAPASAGTGNDARSNATAAKTVSTLGGLTGEGALIAQGSFGPGADASHTYTVNMWVRGETVKISDTDATVNGVTTKYCAHDGNISEHNLTDTTSQHGCELDLPTYSTAWYSAKIKIVANTTATGANMGSLTVPVEP